MRLSAGRIRSINRAMARTHASAYSPSGRDRRRPEVSLATPTSLIPPHTIRIVAVPKAAAV